MYTYKNGTDPVFIAGSESMPLRVLITFYDQGNFYVYYVSDYLRNCYLNLVEKTSILPEELHIDHLKRIESDEVFDSYIRWIENNYNYNGVHIGEKITGHDLGGAVLVDSKGNPLIKGESE